MVPHLTPFVKEVILERLSPKTWLKNGKDNLFEAFGVLSGLPRDIGKLIKQARRGNLKVDLDLKRLDRFGNLIAKSANRLTMGIVTGALIIGSSIAMTIKTGPTLFGMPLLGFIGFVLALVNAIWLMFAIWISSKDER
jgi:ubiquinone biosynthesis protein